MQYGGGSHHYAILKWVHFRAAGEERISCSLAGRQGAVRTLIRSPCSAGARVDDYGLSCCTDNAACSPDSSLRERTPQTLYSTDI